MRISIVLFFLSFFSCGQSSTKITKEQIIGTWIDQHNVKLEFTSDGYYKKAYPDFSLPNKKLIIKNGKYEEIDFGILEYKLKRRNINSFDLRIIGSKNGLEFSKYTIILKDNNLLRISYKTLPGIENHIDEIGWYVKEGTKIKPVKTKIKEKFIIPKGFNKMIYIAYDQPEGQELIQDADGNRILNIPKNGILKTKFKEIPEIMAFQNYEFYENDQNADSLIKMREFQHEDFQTVFKELRKNKGDIKLKYNPDSTAIFVLGFNQVGRNYIEREIFKERIQGNVLMFEVDTISKVFRLDDYLYKASY